MALCINHVAIEFWILFFSFKFSTFMKRVCGVIIIRNREVIKVKFIFIYVCAKTARFRTANFEEK